MKLSTMIPRTPVPRVMRGLGEGALWLGAILGLISITLAVASYAFGLQPLVFRSGSMSPEIKAGALALAKDTPASKVAVGDIVSVTDADDRRVTHRVTAIATSADDSRQKALTLKGDANDTADAEPYIVDSVGRVVFDVPYAGYVAAWLSGPWGMFLGGVLVAGVLLSLYPRPRSGPTPGRRSAGTRKKTSQGLTALIGIGLLAPLAVAQTSTAGTEAAFSDTARFQAGVVGSHRVVAFTWNDPHCTNVGPANSGYHNSVRFNWMIADTRYETAWTSPGLRAPKVDSQTAAAGTSVFTTLTGGVQGGTSDFRTPTTADSVTVTGRSRLRNTPAWLSESTRLQTVDRDSAGRVRCAGETVPPHVTITQPLQSSDDTRARLQQKLNTACGTSPANQAACGTVRASGDKTITKIVYILKRTTVVGGDQCWNGAASTYDRNCGTWHNASASTQDWFIPGSAYSTYFVLGANYVLTVRVTDSENQSHSHTVTYRADW